MYHPIQLASPARQVASEMGQLVEQAGHEKEVQRKQRQAVLETVVAASEHWRREQEEEESVQQVRGEEWGA